MSNNHVEALAKGVAEKAMAAGLEAAVAVMHALADHAVRGKVDASEIRAAAASLELTAERKRISAEEVLRRYNAFK